MSEPAGQGIRWRNPVVANATGVPNTTSIRSGWARSPVILMTSCVVWCAACWSILCVSIGPPPTGSGRGRMRAAWQAAASLESVRSLVCPLRRGRGPPSADGTSRRIERCQPGQFGAGGDAELGEDLVEVVFDGSRADKQLRGDFPVGRPGGGQPGDLQLLGRELGKRGGVAPPCGLAAGAQLGPGAAGPPGGAELL